MRVRLSLVAIVVAALGVSCGAISPSSLEFVDVSPEKPRIGDIATVRFRAVDSRGQPMAGASVSFKLQSDKPGIILSPSESGSNRGDGIASTQVIASTSASSIVVVAESGDKIASSLPITFAGSAPSARQFTFQCGSVAGEASGGIHAISAYDESRSMIAGVKLNCIAHVGDRNGDGIPGVQVSFLTEAGTIGPTETTQSDVIGNAQILYKTSLPLPKDVPPGTFTWSPPTGPAQTGEYLAPLWMHPFSWVRSPVAQYGSTPTLEEPRRLDPLRPTLTLNPRDNLVTMIAFTAGEEAYEDRNNSGSFEEGEPFVDLTEPFVDSDDSGTFDNDERWVDTNGNGKWDGKNGTHDASTLIWVSERILWTGVPHPRDVVGSADPIFRVVQPITPPVIPHFGYVNVQLLVSDPWFNVMAQNGNSDGCHTVGADDKPVVTMLPSRVNGGVRYTYPSFDLVSFAIKDAHDPSIVPAPIPFAPPVTFVAPIFCSYTAAQIDGHVVNLAVQTISGTVE